MRLHQSSLTILFLSLPPHLAPAQVPKITDSEGNSLTGLVGPYNEGDELSLTCLTRGGKSAFELSAGLRRAASVFFRKTPAHTDLVA